jgi:hypothetical protein
MLIVRRLALNWTTPGRRPDAPTAAKGQSPSARRNDSLIAAEGRLRPSAALLTGARDGFVILGGCALAVVAVFTLHVALGRHAPDRTNPAASKDNLYITPVYGEYLHGDRPLSPAVVWDASMDYLHFIHSDYDGIPKTDPNGSQPLEWPFHERTINYRWDSDGTHTSYVQLVGNLWSWILALIAPIAAVVLLVIQRRHPVESTQPARRALMLMLLLQYFVYMAVHFFIGLHRVMYLYHYFIALLLAFCLVPLVVAEAVDRWPSLRPRLAPALGVMTALLLASFVFWSPLNLHRPLTKQQCEWRNVIQHVVNCR